MLKIVKGKIYTDKGKYLKINLPQRNYSISLKLGFLFSINAVTPSLNTSPSQSIR